MTNAYLDFADQVISAPHKRVLRAAEQTAARRAEKAQAGREQQLTNWRRQRRKQQEILLSGPHAKAARELVFVLDALKPDNTGALVDRVCHGPWFVADQETRHQILSLVDTALIEMREVRGLPAFDDPLPDDPPNTFLVLREWLA